MHTLLHYVVTLCVNYLDMLYVMVCIYGVFIFFQLNSKGYGDVLRTFDVQGFGSRAVVIFGSDSIPCST